MKFTRPHISSHINDNCLFPFVQDIKIEVILDSPSLFLIALIFRVLIYKNVKMVQKVFIHSALSFPYY